MAEIAVILILIILALLAAGYYHFNYIIVADNDRWKEKPRPQPDPNTEKGRMILRRIKLKEEAFAIPYEDAWTVSRDGLKLHARLYSNAKAERIVICAHGFHGTGCGDFRVILPMIRKDSTVILIDERGAGESEGKYITFGVKEHEDILLWREYAAKNNPSHLPVYLAGVSMGASSVLLNVKYKEPACAGIIADCGYSSMKNAVADVSMAWFHLPPYPMLWLLDFWCGLLAGFHIRQADIEKALKQTQVPVLFMHGKKDTFVKPENTVRNAAACAYEHQVYWFENSGHASASIDEPERYEKILYDFFEACES